MQLITEDIALKLLRIFKGAVSLGKPVTKIGNVSIKFGIFPDPYKLANISKWFKNAPPLPLAPQLLPLISKIFEKIVHDQMIDYLVQYVI